jgi:uncharacterized protein YyaL (SSP411 family)
MLNNVKQEACQGSAYYANWDILMAWFAQDPSEVVIAGDDFLSKRREFDQYYLPNVFLCGGKEEGTLPVLKGRLVEGQTTIYVCRDNMCKLPVTEVAEAVRQILASAALPSK